MIGELLLILLFNSLICMGIHISTWENNILHGIRKNSLPEWIQRPLYDCPTCMASIHSIYVYWMFMDWNVVSLVMYPMYVFALAAMNTWIYQQSE